MIFRHTLCAEVAIIYLKDAYEPSRLDSESCFPRLTLWAHPHPPDNDILQGPERIQLEDFARLEILKDGEPGMTA